MKRSLAAFLAGMMAGGALVYLLMVSFDKNGREFEMFDMPDGYMSGTTLDIVQVLDDGAIAILDGDEQLSTPVFVFEKEGQHFYDQRKIDIPENALVKTVGVYRYLNTQNIRKTIPIVEIENNVESNK